MNNQDENAWVREFEHVEAKQRQVKTVTFSGGHTYEIPECIYGNQIIGTPYSTIKDDSYEK